MRTLLTFIITLVLPIALLGCRSTEAYEDHLSGWIHADETELVDDWGQPDSIDVEPNGIRWLVYNSSQTASIPPDYHCKTSFKVILEKVAAWKTQGVNCKM